ncbi:hypothetical protein B0H13DRAFT_1887598 [Mycena leptocephala]|nr:hypothetical protein B0H13DRAFT_1887598 [Mycena leptocephala]
MLFHAITSFALFLVAAAVTCPVCPRPTSQVMHSSPRVAELEGRPSSAGTPQTHLEPLALRLNASTAYVISQLVPMPDPGANTSGAGFGTDAKCPATATVEDAC